MATRTNPTLDPVTDKLRQVHTIPALVQYLHDELGWPVNVEDWEDNLFDWQPDELNLKAEHEVKVKSIKQLRPLVSGQPWGIFFVDFAKGPLPITVLRRVLNGLVPKGRATGGGHQTWAAHDLLFVSSFGEGSAREIALAHFTDESAQGDLPTLRVLGWDDDDTPMQLGYVAQTLRNKLRWPAHTRTADDLAQWRAQWSSAFSLGYGQVINDAKTLALAMAELAKRIRRRVNTVLALESASGHLRQMHKAFKDNLIADLSEDAFADMFAQTITYGLFTARASRTGLLLRITPATAPQARSLPRWMAASSSGSPSRLSTPPIPALNSGHSSSSTTACSTASSAVAPCSSSALADSAMRASAARCSGCGPAPGARSPAPPCRAKRMREESAAVFMCDSAQRQRLAAVLNSYSV